ncbi:MAG: glycosyltransferase family 39 protein [Candidatus Omnitrophica bacterium]|nr:glycosyltransferase family 39 protein [Candidatus Omnitrophota bacterium]
MAQKKGHPKSEPFTKAEAVLLFAVLLLALGLRLWGIGFGLPEQFHADEPVVVHHALAYGTGDLNPHFFNIPPLVSYLLAACYGFFYLAASAAGKIGSIAEFEGLFFRDPSWFYLIGRAVLGALAGTANVWILYRLLRKHFSKAHGLLAAFFLAAAFLHVRDSHYIYADIPLLVVLTACFYPIWGFLETGRLRSCLGFGALAGTAVALKYNGVFIFVPFLAAFFLRTAFGGGAEKGRSSELGDPGPYAAALLAALVFSLLNPYAVLDGRFFLSEIAEQARAQGFTGFDHHLLYSLNGGLEFGLFAMAVSGLMISVWTALWRIKRTPQDDRRMTAAAFVVAYYFVIVFRGQHYDRYVLPLVPFLCFFAADLLVSLAKRVKLSDVSTALIGFLIAVPSLWNVCLSNQIFARQDVRALARERLEQVLPAGAALALDAPFFMPRLLPTVEQLEEKKHELAGGGGHSEAGSRRLEWMIKNAARDGRSRYRLHFLSTEPEGEHFLFARPAVPYDVEGLKKRGIQYVLTAKLNPGFQKVFYEELSQKGVLLARFSPYRNKARAWPIDRQPLTGGPFLWQELIAREANGQIIEVYKLN